MFNDGDASPYDTPTASCPSMMSTIVYVTRCKQRRPPAGTFVVQRFSLRPSVGPACVTRSFFVRFYASATFRASHAHTNKPIDYFHFDRLLTIGFRPGKKKGTTGKSQLNPAHDHPTLRLGRPLMPSHE